MPEPAALPAERRRLARQADRRREAARMLALVECTARYGATTLANGASPGEAVETAVFVAEQLEAMALALRRLAAPDGPAERRAQARRLWALGLPLPTIAARLGVSERSVRDYLAGRSNGSLQQLASASGIPPLPAERDNRVTTTTTTYHLRAVTDAATTKTHLGATERGIVTFCGARLIVKGDERFGGRYADRPFTASTDLATIDCGGCLRTAYWKGRKGSTWTAPKTGAAAKDAAAVNAEAGR